MKALEVGKWALISALIVAAVLFLHYNLPRVDVVQITGTDVKRIDRQGTQGQTRTRDVRYISTVARDGEVGVFRNEDTGWGWPPYFKFDSADVTAQAQNALRNPDDPWMRVRYYGWRIAIFSMFPNAVSLKVVDKSYTYFPWFNVIFLTLLAIAIFLIWRLARRLTQRLHRNERFQRLRARF